MKDTDKQSLRIAIVGLGYVGLPLACCFGSRYQVTGFDISEERIEKLRVGNDTTGEVSFEELEDARINFTTDSSKLSQAEFIIVTVPTPIDSHRQPDLSAIRSASEMVGQNMKAGVTIVFESTVYPGVTEEVCLPLLEKHSGLKWMEDFYLGYSPERINPGDREHTITRIQKVVAGDSPETRKRLADLYGSVIEAGVYEAESIQVGEAAKVIENCQRDINIAFVNELALIFQRMGIDTDSVLKAAGTKWNFLPFRPGLVGGHCIGVDPYYLTHKAEELGYNPEVILSGRRINDGMGRYVAGRVIKLLSLKGHRVIDTEILLLGITFKENCSDIRNSRAIDIIRELQDFGATVTVCDPCADFEEVLKEYNIRVINLEEVAARKNFGAVVLAVAHQEFREQPWRDFLTADGVVYDVKGILPLELIDERL